MCQVDWLKVFTCILQVHLLSYSFIYQIMTLHVYVLSQYIYMESHNQIG